VGFRFCERSFDTCIFTASGDRLSDPPKAVFILLQYYFKISSFNMIALTVTVNHCTLAQSITPAVILSQADRNKMLRSLAANFSARRPGGKFCNKSSDYKRAFPSHFEHVYGTCLALTNSVKKKFIII